MDGILGTEMPGRWLALECGDSVPGVEAARAAMVYFMLRWLGLALALKRMALMLRLAEWY